MAAKIMLLCLLLLALCAFVSAQQVTVYIGGRVTDATGAVVPNATVTAVNSQTGFTRTSTTSGTGDYQLLAMPVGDYKVAVEAPGFKKTTKALHLDIGAAAALDFSLAPGQITQEVEVQAQSEVVEPTRSMVSEVIAERQIENLPVNGRQFIDFALLAPGVTVGDTTSGSTDVIIEPVTKLSFAGQNIHFNYVAIDGADNMSTASGIQKTTPSQEAVKEFRVINTDYSAEAGRAVGGIVNIITKSGTNELHGSVYEYFRNDALDAQQILAAPGMHKLRQNQYGFTIGGPIQKDRTFFFGNYEGQRRRESPFYNSVVLNNIDQINAIKAQFGLPAENLRQTRSTDYDNFLVKLDHSFSKKHYFSGRYFFNNQNLLKESPLNDGFDLPSAFRNNYLRDQSVVGALTSTLSNSVVNDLHGQFAHRMFDFPTVTSQPHLEVSNVFTMGVNRGNPDYYKEDRFEIVDNITWNRGKHTVQFGGNFDHVTTTESFPLFYPFEGDFGCLYASQCPSSLQAGSPFALFFERFQAPNYTEPTIDPAVYQGGRIATAIRNQARGTLGHTYNGMYMQDKWRATQNLSLNLGLRYEFETWPSKALNNDMDNFDPRVGFAYSLGTSKNMILRGGAGIFHGTIPSPLLMCQEPSCGGTTGPYPGTTGDALNANSRLFAFGSGPPIMSMALASLMQGTYPDATPAPFCPDGTLATCGFFGDAVIVRFNKNHQAPYGVQTSLSWEFEPFRNAVFSASYLHVSGAKLGSFFNINQPAPSSQVMLHNSSGASGIKDEFFAAPGVPGVRCFAPGVQVNGGTCPTAYGVYFQADSLWHSSYDGLLVNFNKRVSHHFGAGISYTWSKTLDNGPNPSFVLIPQDNTQFGAERALSSDHVGQRFVGDLTFMGPTNRGALLSGWQMGTIITLESPHYFTKFAGFDANGDLFGTNDRVGIEPRNTFKGDNFKTVDLRVSRTFKASEKLSLQGIAEAFNLLNSTNIRFYNTVYGAADFCPFNPQAQGCAGATQFYREGSPNPTYGTPRATFNPRQIQLALRLTF